MATAYTKRFLTFNQPDASNSPSVTVPNGHLFVIRQIDARFGVPATLYVYLTNPQRLLTGLQSVSPSVEYHYDGRIAINAGESFYVQPSGSWCQGQITGYDLLVY